MEVTLITFNVLADVARTRPMSAWHARVPVWDERKALCVQALHQAQPSIIGLQEVMPHQFDFFQAHLPEFRALTVPATTTQDEVLLKVLRETFNLPNIPPPTKSSCSFVPQSSTPSPRATGGFLPPPIRPRSALVGFSRMPCCGVTYGIAPQAKRS